MTHRDNNNPDYSQMSSKDTYIKPNINRRSLGVYEQYLKKTIENINHDLNKSANDTLDYTPDHQKKRGDDSNRTNNDHQMIAATKTSVTAHDSLNNSAKFLMIIGGFCTLLLLALVIILFSTTDILIERIAAVDSQMSEVNNNISVIGKENSLATSIALAEEKVKNSANAENLARVKDSLNLIALNAELVNVKPEVKMTTRMRSLQIGEASLEPEQNKINTKADYAISYDAFKEESQTVLYRESSYYK